MARTTQTIWQCMVAAIVLLAFTGCEAMKATHNENRNAAEQRWLGVRSGLMLQMAQQQFDTGDLDQAESSVMQALAIDKENPHLYVLLGRIELERGRLERSHNWLLIATKFGPKVPTAHYYSGVVLQRWQQFDKALAAYRTAMNLETDNASYVLAYAEMMVQTDQADLAMMLLEEKIQTFDQNAGMRVAVAQIHMLQDNPDKAVEFYRKAAVLRPEDLRIQEELARAQIAAGQPLHALRVLERLTRDPEMRERRDLQRLLGEIYLKTDRPHEARDLFMTLTRQDKNDAQAWLLLGEASWALNDELGALTAVRHAIKNDPTLSKAYLLAGLIFQKRGEVGHATEMFELAAAHAPQDATPRILQGIMHQRNGNVDAAAQAYADALRREPNDPRAQRLLAGVVQSPDGR